MDYLAFRRKSYKARPDLENNYIVCSSCLWTIARREATERLATMYPSDPWMMTWRSGLREYYNHEVRQWIPVGWIPVHTDLTDMGQVRVCWHCHTKILEPEFPITKFATKRYNWCPKKKWHASDTRRISDSGKMIGGSHCRTWGGIGHGKYHKRLLHKAERRYWQRYAEAHIGDPEVEPNVSMGSYAIQTSVVDWRDS